MRRLRSDLGWLSAGLAAWAISLVIRSQLVRALLLLAAVLVLLEGFAYLGGHWVLLPLAPAGYGLGLAIRRALVH